MTGYPKTIRIDQGSEFVSCDLDLWTYTHSVTLASCPFRELHPVRNWRVCQNRHIFVGMISVLHALALFFGDVFKLRRRLEAENLTLRHQLNVALRRASLGSSSGTSTACF